MEKISFSIKYDKEEKKYVVRMKTVYNRGAITFWETISKHDSPMEASIVKRACENVAKALSDGRTRIVITI